MTIASARYGFSGKAHMQDIGWKNGLCAPWGDHHHHHGAPAAAASGGRPCRSSLPV